MGNMSYCRFENTSKDLDDCYHNMDEDVSGSDYETVGRKKLIKLCCDIAVDYGHEVDREIIEE